LTIERGQQRNRNGQADDSDEDDGEHHLTQSACMTTRLKPQPVSLLDE